MRVLVTGGAGYIGSHACKALARAGHFPVTFDNLSTGHRWAVKWGPLVIGDLADTRVLKQALSDYAIDSVMHFAASAYVGASMSDPRGYYHNNLMNGVRLLDALVDAGVQRIVFSSSCATFGHQKTPLLDETHPQSPVNPYGETKLALERALRWYGDAYGLESVILRYFNAAGADADGDTGESHDPEPHLIPSVLRAATGALPEVEILGDDYPTPDGTAVRDYVHVTDLAGAHVLALDHLARGGGSLDLNLGTGRGYSVREVVAAAERVVGHSVPTRVSPRRPGDPPSLVADGRAARRELDWRPRCSDLPTIIGSAWRWYEQTRRPDARRRRATLPTAARRSTTTGLPS